MGMQQSKDELLFQQVSFGNIEAIKSLHSEGAGLEYVDREGKTPLIAACLNPTLYNVAKTLIELGANVNSYRRGWNGGTPLHHAAKHGHENMVKLLLSNGANAILMNDNWQTPLAVARAKGHRNVVRLIESHICLFSGWLLELYGPGFMEIFAPQLLSRKVWVAVVPCGSRNLRKPFKLELAIYDSNQDAQPRTTILLWKANMEEPVFSQPDPAVIISEASTVSRCGRRRSCRPRHVKQKRIKLAPVTERDKEQLKQFCSACKGIPQVMHTTFPFNTPTPSVAAPPPSEAEEDVELAMAISASIQTAVQEGVPLSNTEDSSRVNNPNKPVSTKQRLVDQPIEEAGPSNICAMTNNDTQAPTEPSAPALTDEVLRDGPIHYPIIDLSTVNTSDSLVHKIHPNEIGNMNVGSSSSCIICFDSPVEGACVPCGHMAGCMSCLNEIKAKKWGCPVCRTKIDQVIKVYSV